MERLQATVSELPRDAILKDLPTHHYWADGMYARVLHSPAKSLVIGKAHKKAHFFLVLKGSYLVGKDMVYEAGTVIVSQPGTKRSLIALEDSVCLTVHKTKKRNLKEIEKELIEPDKTALFDSENRMKVLK